jgi:hypothetical protein
VDAWLQQAAKRLARRAHIAADQLQISDEEIESLLEDAGHAPHESGSRTNAPLYCYLLGKASSLSGIDVARLQGSSRGRATG